jgi:hypothetical protein
VSSLGLSGPVDFGGLEFKSPSNLEASRPIGLCAEYAEDGAILPIERWVGEDDLIEEIEEIERQAADRATIAIINQQRAWQTQLVVGPRISVERGVLMIFVKWALREFLWVQIKLSQVKKNCTAESDSDSEPARFGFQLLNSSIDALC